MRRNFGASVTKSLASILANIYAKSGFSSFNHKLNTKMINVMSKLVLLMILVLVSCKKLVIKKNGNISKFHIGWKIKILFLNISYLLSPILDANKFFAVRVCPIKTSPNS